MSQRARPSAGLFHVVAPVAAFGVDGVGGDDFAGVEVDDGDGGFVDESDDAFASMFDADAEVVHSAGPAEAPFAVVGDVVVAEPEMALAGGSGESFRGRSVGGAGCLAVVAAVRAVLVVVVSELVKLVLKFGNRCRGWSGGEPSFQGLMEPFDLALGLWVAGRAVLLLGPEEGQQIFEGVAAAAEPGSVNASVIGQRRGVNTVFIGSGKERGHDVVAG